MPQLLDYIQDALAKPMQLLKNGKPTGETISPMEAMVNALISKATKGDIPSIAFITNLQRTHDPKADSDYAQAQADRVKEIADRLRLQLEGEGLWDGQDTELANLAETQYLTEQLTEALHAPDFQPVTTEYASNGTTRTVANPVIALLDTQKDRFQKQLDKLRADAMQRKVRRRIDK